MYDPVADRHVARLEIDLAPYYHALKQIREIERHERYHKTMCQCAACSARWGAL